MAGQPLMSLDLLTVEALRSPSHTPHTVEPSGPVISPSQRPLRYNTQDIQQTDIHDPGGIRTRNSSKPAASDPHLRPTDHWDESTVFRMNPFLIEFTYIHVVRFTYNRILTFSKSAERRVWSCCIASYCTCLTFCAHCTLLMPVFQPSAEPSHAEASVLGKVVGNLRAIFMPLIGVIVA
jgi:hypothetical protein